MEPLLEIQNLSAHFIRDDGVVRAVDGVDLEIKTNEIFALVGESGSGKSVLGLAVLRLLPENIRLAGEIRFQGRDLMKISEEEMRKVRGGSIGWIPQNPTTSMNPVMRVGDQIAEPMELHLGLNREQAWKRAVSLLDFFGMRPAESLAKEYPFRYSGGMLERALVAMGTAARPVLVIADEPTKGVDSLKKQRIAALFNQIRQENISILLITHDLPFAMTIADRVGVNYCGQILEISETGRFFSEPAHPYSQALLESLPSRGLKPMNGHPPTMMHPPEGCRFAPRCEYATDRCRKDPPVREYNGSLVRCWLYD